MPKLKRLLPSDKDVVEIDIPVSEDETLDRQLQYPILQPNKFAKRYHKHLYAPVSFKWEGKEYSIQANHCTNPFCESFGLKQERFDAIKNKPYRYKLKGSSKNGTKSIFCNPIPIPTNLPKVSLGCTTYTVSNWSIAEEIKRLIELQTVEELQPEYVFHKEGCSLDGVTPFDEPKKFHSRGTSTSKSPKYQCLECNKYTNVLPSKRRSTTYHQKRNDVLPMFSKLLLSKTPVKRTCEILKMGNKTYYTKLEWLYRCCIEFLEKHEKKGFQRISFDELWINSDKMQYYLNNVRQKGRGGTHYSDIEDKILQTHIVISADVKSRYVFRSDIAYDWNVTLKQLEEETLWYRDDHVDSFCRKNDRLRFSYYPQEPSKVDEQTHSGYNEEFYKIKEREKYIDGLHVKSNYTAMAHFWLIKQMVQAKEWRFVTDEDYSLINSVYRMFSDDFRLYNAHHFINKIDKTKSRKQAYEEYIEARKFLKSWGEGKNHTNVAHAYLVEQLKTHQFCKEVQLPDKKVMAYLNNPINHPLPGIDKGTMTVDCRTDISGFDNSKLASMILNVSDHATNSFIQQIRRRISILERPLMTARAEGKSYIYANFNPKYAQYAITILRTFYNFCYTDKEGKTPSQRIGITNKVFDVNDILYKT
ncbi:insertion element protein [Bacillus sp. AK128]